MVAHTCMPSTQEMRQEHCYELEATETICILTVYVRDEHELALAAFFPRGLVCGNSSRVVLSGTLLTAQEYENRLSGNRLHLCIVSRR